jgi:hypothetical protein
VYLARLLAAGPRILAASDKFRAVRSDCAALLFSEDNVPARTELGVIQAARGELRAALDSFLHVLRVMPGFPPACERARRTSEVLGVRAKELETCSPIAAGE